MLLRELPARPRRPPVWCARTGPAPTAIRVATTHPSSRAGRSRRCGRPGASASPWNRWYRAGMSLRAVRSPLAPKMTMEHGSTTLRPSLQATDQQLIELFGLVHGQPSSSRTPISSIASCLHPARPIYIPRHPAADVAELADALDSKSGTRKSVWVRPPPSAPPNLLMPAGADQFHSPGQVSFGRLGRVK